MSDNPFAFVDAASFSKKNLIRDGSNSEDEYNPFLTNRAFSYHPDTVLYAAEMNMHRDLDSLMQFEFYLHALRPLKRYGSKWSKSIVNEDEDLVMRRMGINRKRAREVLILLSKQDIEEMKKEDQSE